MGYKLGSLFDGSGGFPLSGALCGIEPCWAAEVEPYPIAVTRTRFPNMKHLGDISKVNGAEIEPVDIITFGSPCQDLSVAGKRAGLKHEANGDEETTRSGLFMEAVRIIKEMREATNGLYPRYALWENVPGAFSSNKGEDFRIVCEELIKVIEPAASMPPVPQNGWNYADSYLGDGWSLAYRVFDAQYWGVPQRRRRIHLIADFRGTSAREVLFEREGLRGYFAEGRTPWKAAPADAQDCPGATDREGEGFDGYNGDLTGGVSATLGVNCGVSTGRNGVIERGLDAVAYTLKIRGGVAVDSGGKAAGKGALVQTDLSATLGCNQDQYLFQPTAYSFDSLASNSMKSNNPHSGCREVGVAKTLDTTDPNPSKNQGGIAIVEPVAFAQNQRDEVRLLGDRTGALQAQPGMKQQTFILDNLGGQAEYGKASPVNDTLRAGAQGAVAYVVENHPADSRVNLDESGKVQTLTSRMGTGGGNVPMVMEPFCKSSRPRSADDATTWIPGKVANTLNTFDVGEVRANELVVEAQPVYCLQGKGIDRADTASCNGKGWKEDTCYTLNTIDRPAVAFQTYQKVSGPLMANSHPGSYTGQDAFSDMLVAGPAVAYVDTTHADDVVRVDTVTAPLQARDYKGGKLVQVRYIVRRLTPTECARLQGFADRWGDIEVKDSFTDEEYAFWLKVRKTHAGIFSKIFKKYTKPQMLTWYNKLQTDAAEYKMWGNGIALPPALYCMQGIVDALNAEEDDSWIL